MTNTSTNLTIVPAPKFAGMKDWDCCRCGRQEVKPVFLSDGGAYGSGCAAVMLGRPRAARKIRDEAAAADRRAAMLEELRLEQMARYGRALDTFTQSPNVDTPELLNARRTYHALGGFERLGKFPVWMAQIAAAGLPATG